jgi:hypothetical protein
VEFSDDFAFYLLSGCSYFLEARRYMMSKVKPARGIKKSKNSKLPEPPSGASPKIRSIKSMVPFLTRSRGKLQRIRLYPPHSMLSKNFQAHHLLDVD